MNKVLTNKKSDLVNLCKLYNVNTMYVFGSAGTDNFDDNSDIDILISFDELPIDKYTENYFSLHYDLEKLFNRPIDLVTENSLSNPYFIQGINRTKKLIYAA